MDPSSVDGANGELCIVIVHFEMLSSGIRHVQSITCADDTKKTVAQPGVPIYTRIRHNVKIPRRANERQQLTLLAPPPVTFHAFIYSLFLFPSPP